MTATETHRIAPTVDPSFAVKRALNLAESGFALRLTFSTVDALRAAKAAVEKAVGPVIYHETQAADPMLPVVVGSLVRAEWDPEIGEVYTSPKGWTLALDLA